MENDILLIEENTEIRKRIAALLRGEGYSVAESDCGVKAVEMACHKLPALIICETVMHCMDGYDVFLALFKPLFYHKIPFIYFLGDVHLKTARVLSIENYSGEQFQEGDLLRCVKDCLPLELPAKDLVMPMPSIGAIWP